MRAVPVLRLFLNGSSWLASCCVHVCMYVYLQSLYLTGWLLVARLYVCLSVRLSVCTSICLFHSSNHLVRNSLPYSFQIGSTVAATMSIDDRESTKLILEVVAVAESNGLKLPREFGLLLKQVNFFF